MIGHCAAAMMFEFAGITAGPETGAASAGENRHSKRQSHRRRFGDRRQFLHGQRRTHHPDDAAESRGGTEKVTTGNRSFLTRPYPEYETGRRSSHASPFCISGFERYRFFTVSTNRINSRRYPCGSSSSPRRVSAITSSYVAFPRNPNCAATVRTSPRPKRNGNRTTPGLRPNRPGRPPFFC